MAVDQYGKNIEMDKINLNEIYSNTLPEDDSKEIYFELISMSGLDEMHEYSVKEEFYEFFHDDIGENCELRLKDGLVNSGFDFLLNNRELFSIIEEITECLPIDRFVARVYRFEPFSQNGCFMANLRTYL